MYLPRPVGDNLLVILPELKTKSESGIAILESTAKAQQSYVATVLNVGTSDSAKEFIIGGKVLIRQMSGIEVDYHGKEALVIKVSDVKAHMDYFIPTGADLELLAHKLVKTGDVKILAFFTELQDVIKSAPNSKVPDNMLPTVIESMLVIESAFLELDKNKSEGVADDNKEDSD